MTYTLSQDAADMNLQWREGDTVSLAWTVSAVNWAGTYKLQVRDTPYSTGTLICTLTVVATYSAPDTGFVATLADSTAVPAGTYYYDMQNQTGPLTRLSGKVFVTPQVTT